MRPKNNLIDWDKQSWKEKIDSLESGANPAIFVRLAEELRLEGNMEEAIRICQDGIKEYPDYLTGRIVLGKCYYDQQNFSLAMESFREALKIDPENIVAFKYIGDILQKKGDAVLASEYYKRVKEIDPEFVIPKISGQPEKEISPQKESGWKTQPHEEFEETEEFKTSTPRKKEEQGILIGVEKETTTTSEDSRIEEVVQEEVGVSELKEPAPAKESTPGKVILETATIAEIYAKQGFPEMALDVYQRLAKKNPQDSKIKKRIEELKALIASSKNT